MHSPSKLLAIVAVFSLFSCKSAAPGSVMTGEAVEKELGADVEKVPNESGQYVLIRQKTIPGQLLRFVVVESTTTEIVERGSLMPGYVKWKDDITLEVLSLPGTLRDGEDLSRYIRVIRIKTTP